MDIHPILFWLTMCPWLSTRNLKGLTDIGVSSINRALDKYYKSGFVVSRMIGRGSKAVRRWILTSEFLELYYSVDHVHGPAGGPDGHRHYAPYSLDSTHEHIPWHLREAGVRTLYGRLEPHIYFYELAGQVFREGGQVLLEYVKGETPKLTQWAPIRRGQLVEAVAVYENEHDRFVVVFCWLGKQLKVRRMLEKWDYRFANLTGTSRAREMMRPANMFDTPDPPDPDFDDTPQPSLYVMVGQDEYIVRRAMDLIPRGGYLHENAFSWWVGGHPCRKIAESGRAWPGADYLYEELNDFALGEPQDAVLPAGDGGRDGYPDPTVLSLVLPYRILSIAEEWAAILEEDAEELLGVEDGSVPGAFQSLKEAGLLTQVEEVYYPSPFSMKLLAAVNRISPKTIENRLRTYLDESMQRHHHDLTHNRGVLEIVRILHRHGIKVHGAFRDVHHLQEVTQIQPDGVLYADGRWGPGLYFVEYERSATTPEAVTTKLRTYRRLNRSGIQINVIWITDTRVAADRFLLRAGNINVMATTLEELRGGPISGPGAVWRCNGNGRAELRPL